MAGDGKIYESNIKEWGLLNEEEDENEEGQDKMACE